MSAGAGRHRFDWPMAVELARQDVCQRYAGSLFGRLWTFLLPLCNILLFVTVFSALMNARLSGGGYTGPYTVYLIAGLLPWFAFYNTVTRCSTALIDRRMLITRTAISPLTLFVSVALGETVSFGIYTVLFILFLICAGGGLGWWVCAVPFVFFVQEALALAVGGICGVVIVFIRDVREIIAVVFQFLFWLTPIVYVREILPAAVQGWLVANPVYLLIRCYHRIYLYRIDPFGRGFAAACLFTAGIVSVAVLVLRRTEKEIRDTV